MTILYIAIVFFVSLESSALAAKDALHLHGQCQLTTANRESIAVAILAVEIQNLGMGFKCPCHPAGDRERVSYPIGEEPLSCADYIKTCDRDSPHLNSCLLNSLRDLHPYLVRGIPHLDLPPIDPFRLEETLLEYHNGQIHAKFGIKDYSLYGLRDLQFQQVRADFFDLDDFKLDIVVFIPKVKSDGRYKLQGKFVKSEFGGKGTFNVSMSNIKAKWSFSGSREVVDGVTFMRMKHLDMEPVIGDMKVYASNLFNGNEALSKSALKLFNQHWRLVYKELLPYIQKDWDRIMTEIANRVFMRVPFDEIFPDSSKSQISGKQV